MTPTCALGCGPTLTGRTAFKRLFPKTVEYMPCPTNKAIPCTSTLHLSRGGRAAMSHCLASQILTVASRDFRPCIHHTAIPPSLSSTFSPPALSTRRHRVFGSKCPCALSSSSTQLRTPCRRYGRASHRSPMRAVSEGVEAEQEASPNETYKMWDRATNTLTACSTVANLLMLMPQIFKNAGSLLAGQNADLAALSWVAFSTGFLGNMLLLSYFTEQKQASACLVQVVGASTTLTLLVQIFLAGYMPSLACLSVSSFFAIGVIVNALRYTGSLPGSAWAVWQDFVGILGLAVLPQVLWSSFSAVPTPIPGAAAALAGVGCVAKIRSGSAPQALVDTWQKLSGWTATLLFMFMPVAQLQACLANPENLAGLSPISNVLGLVGNGLMVPRALFTRDLIWFTGSSWGALMMGWGMLLALAAYSYFPLPAFGAISIGFFSYLATVLVLNAKAHNLKSPIASIFYLKP